MATAIVKTDATYYYKGATTIDVTADVDQNVVDLSKVAKVIFTLYRSATGNTPFKTLSDTSVSSTGGAGVSFILDSSYPNGTYICTAEYVDYRGSLIGQLAFGSSPDFYLSR